jgi:hypothetical protein
VVVEAIKEEEGIIEQDPRFLQMPVDEVKIVAEQVGLTPRRSRRSTGGGLKIDQS